MRDECPECVSCLDTCICSCTDMSRCDSCPAGNLGPSRVLSSRLAKVLTGFCRSLACVVQEAWQHERRRAARHLERTCSRPRLRPVAYLCLRSWPRDSILLTRNRRRRAMACPEPNRLFPRILSAYTTLPFPYIDLHCTTSHTHLASHSASILYNIHF